MTSPGQRPEGATETLSPAARRAKARLAADARWLQACGGNAPLAAFLELVGARWASAQARKVVAIKDELSDWSDGIKSALRDALHEVAERARR